MLFAVGSRVRLRLSKDEGTITALLDNGMVRVRLETVDMEIPVFMDDLERVEDRPQPGDRARIVPGKKPPLLEMPPPASIESQYAILKRQGLQLAFDPILRNDGTAEAYTIYLINGTIHDLIFSFYLHQDDRTMLRQNGRLNRMSATELGQLRFEQLNFIPQVAIDCWRILPDGTGGKLSKTIRIKPKAFFKKITTAPLLNRPVHLYRVFEELTAERRPGAPREDLQSYTRQHLTPPKKTEDQLRQVGLHEVQELAEFIPEIDLHIEKLTTEYQKMDNLDIIGLQIRHFEAYLDKAVRLGVERVFIIHGVGKGQLRKAIARRLRDHPYVRDFKNEYHPRYGWGATEVIFD